MGVKAAALLLSIAFLAGCAQGPSANGHGQDAKPEASSASPAVAAEPPLSLSVEDAAGYDALTLNECHDGVTTAAYLPAAAIPASPWSDPADPAVPLYLDLLECARFSWGPFERGPVHILLEYHGSLSPPDACQKGSHDASEALTQVWVDDAEVAAALASRLGLPAKVASFQRTPTALAAETAQQWRFAAAGAQESTLTAASPASADQSWAPTFRLFWFPEPGRAGFLDLTMDQHYAIASKGAVGTLAAPLVYAGAGGAPFAATGSVVLAATYTGTFHSFGDLSCEQPP